MDEPPGQGPGVMRAGGQPPRLLQCEPPDERALVELLLRGPSPPGVSPAKLPFTLPSEPSDALLGEPSGELLSWAGKLVEHLSRFLLVCLEDEVSHHRRVQRSLRPLELRMRRL